MEFSEQVRQFIADSNWEELSAFLNKHIDAIEAYFNTPLPFDEEKIAAIKQQVADIEALAHLINEQKQEVEQQLVSLKRSRAVSRLYSSDEG